MLKYAHSNLSLFFSYLQVPALQKENSAAQSTSSDTPGVTRDELHATMAQEIAETVQQGLPSLLKKAYKLQPIDSKEINFLALCNANRCVIVLVQGLPGETIEYLRYQSRYNFTNLSFASINPAGQYLLDWFGIPNSPIIKTVNVKIHHTSHIWSLFSY